MTDNLIRGLLLLSAALDDHDHEVYAYGGLLRQAAQRVAELEALLAASGAVPGGCARCGGEVVQPSRGRRRIHCEGCRPSRAKSSPNATMAS